MDDTKGLSEGDISLEKILEEAKTLAKERPPAPDFPSPNPQRLWSAMDIDQLLAETRRDLPTRREETPPPAQAPAPAAQEPLPEAKPPEIPAQAPGPEPEIVQQEAAVPEVAPEQVTPSAPMPDAEERIAPPEQAEAGSDDIFVILSANQKPKGERKDTKSHKRDRFFDTLQVADPADIRPREDGPIEKPGILLEPGNRDKTADLEPLPTIISADEILRGAVESEKTKVHPLKAAKVSPPVPPEEEPDFEENQLLLSGFGEKLGMEQLSEDEIESELQEKRKDKIKAFRLTAEHIAASEREIHALQTGVIDPPPPSTGRDDPLSREDEDELSEYLHPQQYKRLRSSLMKSTRRTVLRILLLSIAFVAVFLLNLLPLLFQKRTDAIPELLRPDGFGLVFLNFFLLFVPGILCLPEILAGLRSALLGKPKHDSLAGILFLVAVISDVLQMLFYRNNGTVTGLFAASVLFLLLMNLHIKRLTLRRTTDNLIFCADSYKRSLYSVTEIERDADATEIGRGLLMGKPELLYSHKIRFPDYLLRNSFRSEMHSKQTLRLLVCSVLAAIASAALYTVLQDNVSYAISAFTGTLILGVPMSVYAAAARMLHLKNKKLHRIGAAIVSLDAAQQVNFSNAAVLNAGDLFNRALCDMHGMKDYKNVRIDDVLLYTAAMVVESDGPLTEVFEKVIVGRTELLPKVKNLHYEDKLGLSGWIHGQKVFLGNRELLHLHGIEVPAKSSEERYLKKGRKVLYLAIAGKIAAMYVVSYAPDTEITPYIADLPSDGMYLLVGTNDANVSEDSLEQQFDLPHGSVKIMSSQSARLFRDYHNAESDRGEARLLHDGKAASFFQLISGAGQLNNGLRVYTMLQYILSGVALGAMLLAPFLHLPPSYLDVLCCLFHSCSLLLLFTATRHTNTKQNRK